MGITESWLTVMGVLNSRVTKKARQMLISVWLKGKNAEKFKLSSDLFLLAFLHGALPRLLL